MRVERRVLTIIQRLPVPFDRRVWHECQALASAGYRAAVVCPKGPQLPYKALCALGRKTHQAANHVIATNDSYRHVTATRSGNFAEAIVKLMNNEARRVDLGPLGHPHVAQELARSHRERAYLGVYQRLATGAGTIERIGS